MSVSGGVPIGLVAAIVGGIVGLGAICICAGVLFYRRSVGKGFFTSEKKQKVVKATPAAPNLAELGLAGDGAPGLTTTIPEGGVVKGGPEAVVGSFPFAHDDDDDDDEEYAGTDSQIGTIDERIPPAQPANPLPLTSELQRQAQGGAAAAPVAGSSSGAYQRPLTKAEEAGYLTAPQPAAGGSLFNAPNSHIPYHASDLPPAFDAASSSSGSAYPIDRKQATVSGAAAIASLAGSSSSSSSSAAPPADGTVDPATAAKYGIDLSLPPAIQQKLLKEKIRDAELAAPGYDAPPPAAGGATLAVLQPATDAAAPPQYGGDAKPVPPQRTSVIASDAFICVRPYNARLDDELELAVGDKVQILQSFPDGWGSGKNERTGKTGMFPLSTVVAAALNDGSLKILQG